jgi:hypothetical protein
MTDPIIIRKPQERSTRQLIEEACLRCLGTVMNLQGVRSKFGVETAYEPTEKFRVYTVTVSEKVE